MKRAAAYALALFALLCANGAIAADKKTENAVRVDAATTLLMRGERTNGSAYLFADDPRFGLSLRGAIWRDFPYRQRLGVWVGYRYEPGPAWVTLTRGPSARQNDPGSAGVKSWMLAHDLSIGPVYDVSFLSNRDTLAFVRVYAGLGATFATRQIQSRDDGHIYSDTDPAFNLTGTIEVGKRHHSTGLELFVGTGYLCNTSLGMELKQDNVTFPSRTKDIADVTRHGALVYAGLGLEL